MTTDEKEEISEKPIQTIEKTLKTNEKFVGRQPRFCQKSAPNMFFLTYKQHHCCSIYAVVNAGSGSELWGFNSNSKSLAG